MVFSRRETPLVSHTGCNVHTHWSRRSITTLITLIAFFAAAPNAAQTFANLDRYANANAKLLKSGRDLEVVIIGDSITDKWSRMRPHFFKETGWVGRGITSETTPQMLLRFRQDVLGLNPNTVVILGGTNDIADNSGPMRPEDTLHYIDSMVQMARGTGVNVVLCTVLPARLLPWNTRVRPDLEIPKVNALLRDYSERESVPLVNFYSVMTDGNGGMRDALSDDGVHPNSLGYSAMERRLTAQIKSTGH
jgi:lysophospholipase L1-like esterase